MSVSQMIFLSWIVPITGVAQLGKNLPPTKTSEPGLGWGSHHLLGLTNIGAEGTWDQRRCKTLHNNEMCVIIMRPGKVFVKIMLPGNDKNASMKSSSYFLCVRKTPADP